MKLSNNKVHKTNQIVIESERTEFLEVDMDSEL